MSNISDWIELENNSDEKRAVRQAEATEGMNSIEILRFYDATEKRGLSIEEAKDEVKLTASMSNDEYSNYVESKTRVKQYENYVKKNSAAYHIDEFIHGIKESANTPAISTGFIGLDEALGGGVYEGLYVLGAISSLGKTTFTLQLADQMANQGEDVLIFSLEMARTELMAKSISRNTFIYCQENNIRSGCAKTTRGITDGARWEGYSAQEKDVISKSVEAYREYADGIYIHEGIGNIGTQYINSIINLHKDRTGNKPVVIIDYLQLLAPSDPRLSDKQNTDKNILELKRLSREHKIPIIAISSFNRESYKSSAGGYGRVSVSDFKESGAIEYSADVLIGLEFQSAGTRDYNEKEAKQKDPREIRLVIMKNRNYKAWEEVNYYYYPMFNYYQEETPADAYKVADYSAIKLK